MMKSLYLQVNETVFKLFVISNNNNKYIYNLANLCFSHKCQSKNVQIKTQQQQQQHSAPDKNVNIVCDKIVKKKTMLMKPNRINK